MSPRLIILALIAASAGLAACGKTADLDRPAPMFGAANDSAPITKSREDAAARALADADRVTPADNAPQSIGELRDYTGAAKPKKPVKQADPTTDTPQPR